MKMLQDIEKECGLNENHQVQIPLETVKFYWVMVRKILIFVKAFTGNKTDAAIDKFIQAANVLFLD